MAKVESFSNHPPSVALVDVGERSRVESPVLQVSNIRNSSRQKRSSGIESVGDPFHRFTCVLTYVQLLPEHINGMWNAFPPHKSDVRFLNLVLVLFCSFCSPAQAQVTGDACKKADADRTAVYRQALARFSNSNQEPLRRAERAWIVYSDKQEVLLESLRSQNLLTQEAVNAAVLEEVERRSSLLMAHYVTDHPVLKIAEMACRSQERALQTAYDACLQRLNAKDQRLLREAERAWIAYRDVDAESVKIAYETEGARGAVTFRLAVVRTTQLNALVSSLGAGVPRLNLFPEIQPSNPEAVKAVGEFRNDAQMLLKQLLSRKDDSFWKRSDALKNVSALPQELAAQIANLETKYVELSRHSESAVLLAPVSAEYTTLRLLRAWIRFTELLKTGHVEDAGMQLSSTAAFKPKDITPEYLPFWGTIGRWHEVYRTDVAKSEAHITKAKYFASSGKTTEAIKEYQEAYEIIENPSIPPEIKKLRMQSLGL